MIRISIAAVLLLAPAAAGAACTKSQTEPTTAAEASPGVPERQRMGPGMMGKGTMATGDACPMTVADTTVRAAETSDGMTLTFTTPGDVRALRERVRAMADRMNTGSSGGMGMHEMTGAADGGSHMMMGGGGMGSGMPGMMAADGGHGTMGGGMMGGGVMGPMRAQAEEVDGGARLRMTPLDSSRRGELKQHVQQREQIMNESHGCPMMGAAR